jgi:hypothetical protein
MVSESLGISMFTGMTVRDGNRGEDGRMRNHFQFFVIPPWNAKRRGHGAFAVSREKVGSLA